MHFDPEARVFALSNWHKIQLCDKFSSVYLYLFDSIFSVIVWSNRLYDFDEGICFPDNCCYGNGQKTFLPKKFKPNITYIHISFTQIQKIMKFILLKFSCYNYILQNDWDTKTYLLGALGEKVKSYQKYQVFWKKNKS